jgi:hypothetical protein
MKDKVWLVVILSIVLSVFVVAGTACAQGVKTLKVGTVLPLNFGMGVDTKKALEMQIGQFNDAGGITIKGPGAACVSGQGAVPHQHYLFSNHGFRPEHG